MSWIHLLDRPIAFYPMFVRLTGSLNSALMLSQALYWTKRTKDPDGWFYKSREEWFDELYLKRSEQEGARTKLRNTRFWKEELRGVPARLFYRIDIEELEIALSSERPPVDLGTLLAESAAVLASLSKAGYMRAVKAGVVAEHVDYAEVLRTKGLTCGICGHQITKPVGQRAGYLAFDHIVPICQGGPHTMQNLQPAHAHCNLAKSGRAVQLAYAKPTGLLTLSLLDGLDEADWQASGKPTLLIDPETTTETTTIDLDLILRKPELIKPAITRTFQYWQHVMANVPNLAVATWKLTKERKTQMHARFMSDLKWTERNLREGIVGMAMTEFNMGDNPQSKFWIEPNIIFRNDTQLERYIMTFRGKVPADQQAAVLQAYQWRPNGESKSDSAGPEAGSGYEFKPQRRIG